MGKFLIFLLFVFSLPSFAGDASADAETDPCAEIQLTFDGTGQIYVDVPEGCENEAEEFVKTLESHFKCDYIPVDATGDGLDGHLYKSEAPECEAEECEGEEEEEAAHCEDGDEEGCEHEVFRPNQLIA